MNKKELNNYLVTYTFKKSSGCKLKLLKATSKFDARQRFKREMIKTLFHPENIVINQIKQIIADKEEIKIS